MKLPKDLLHEYFCGKNNVFNRQKSCGYHVITFFNIDKNIFVQKYLLLQLKDNE